MIPVSMDDYQFNTGSGVPVPFTVTGCLFLSRYRLVFHKFYRNMKDVQEVLFFDFIIGLILD